MWAVCSSLTSSCVGRQKLSQPCVRMRAFLLELSRQPNLSHVVFCELDVDDLSTTVRSKLTRVVLQGRGSSVVIAFLDLNTEFPCTHVVVRYSFA